MVQPIITVSMTQPRGGGGGGGGGGNCTPTRNQGKSEVKWSRQNFETGQAVKIGIGGSLRTVKVSPGDRWAWLMLNSQGSRPDFWCGQGIKHEKLMDQDLEPGRGWKYRRLCSVPPPPPPPPPRIHYNKCHISLINYFQNDRELYVLSGFQHSHYNTQHNNHTYVL